MFIICGWYTTGRPAHWPPVSLALSPAIRQLTPIIGDRSVKLHELGDGRNGMSRLAPRGSPRMRSQSIHSETPHTLQ